MFFGGSLLAHRLASGVSPADGEPEPGSFFDWLVEALTPTANTVEALGNTMFLASTAILMGAVVGIILAGLLQIRYIGSVVGLLPIPLMALAVPGLILFPLADAAVGRGLIPEGPLSDGALLADSLRFIGFWGLLAGMAIVPTVAAVTAGGGRHRYRGMSVGEAPLAARTGPTSGWRIGLPTTAIALSVASAEIVSGHPGLFQRFATALEVGRPVIALDTAVVVIAAAALVALAVDMVATVTSRQADGADGGVRRRIAQVAPSRALVPLFGLLVLATGLAGAGFSLDSTDNADPTNSLASPAFGGPWLGTDELGRSVLGLVAESIGPAMVAALVPATIAVAIGLILAWIRRAAPAIIDRILGALVDVLWWPLPIMVPLAGRFWGPLDQPEFHLGLLGLTGLMLAPLASRLMARSVFPAHSMRLLRAVAVLLFTTAVSLAIYLLADYMGSYGIDGRIGLGRLLFDGVQGYEQASWALIGPSLAAVVLLFMFLAFSASVASPTGALEDHWDRMRGGDKTSILEGLDELPDHEEPPPTVRLETEPFDETHPLDVDHQHEGFEPVESPDLEPEPVELLAEDIDDKSTGQEFPASDDPTERFEPEPIADAPPMPDFEPAADKRPMADVDPIADMPPMPDSEPIADTPPMPGGQPIAGTPPMPVGAEADEPEPIDTTPPMPDTSLATGATAPSAPPMPGSDFSLSARADEADDDRADETDIEAVDDPDDDAIDHEVTDDDVANDDRAIDLRDSPGDGMDDDGPMEIDQAEVIASRTIELRPSTLRRAQARARQRAKAAGRPILAARSRRGQDSSDSN